MRKIKPAATVVIVLAILLNCRAQAQVIQQVPSDAMVVLKVNNLKSMSDKVAKLAQDLGLAAMAPPLADPLAFLQTQGKMQQGLNVNGDFAFVVLDPAVAGGDSNQAILILVPVTDYKAFLANYADAKTDAGISEINFGNNPKSSFVASWGSYAAISPSKDVVSKKPTGGLNVPAITSKEMSSKDAIVYANFAVVRAKLLPPLQQSRANILTEMENGLKNNPQTARYTPVIKAVATQALDVAEGFLTQTQAATFGVSIVPEGINTTLMAEFSPGTYAGNMMTSEKNIDGAMLSGLPTAQYLFFGGVQSDPTVRVKAINDFLAPIEKELAAIGPDMKPVEDYLAAFKANLSTVKGQSFGMIAPTGALGADPLLQFIMVQGGDSAALMSSNQKMMELQPEMMKAFNSPGADSMKPTHTANAKTIDGVSFDQIVTKIDANAQSPIAMQQAQMMNMMYGPQGAVVDYGAVGADKLLIVSGIKDELISAAIKASKENAAPLADGANIKAVNAQLPKQRLGVVYLALGDIASTGLNYARQFGFAMPLQLPPDLPPIGVALSTDGTAMRVDTHIPTTLVQSIVAAAIQVKMQQQGGAPPGGGI